MFCRDVLDLSKGEDRTPEASQQVASFRDSHVVMGEEHHGFYHKICEDKQGVCYYLGNRCVSIQEFLIPNYPGEFIG